MPDQQLDILIRTLGETYGVEEVNRRMHELTERTRESGHEASRHNEHHREMHMLFRQLNRILPESGHLLHGIFGGPQVLAILAMVAAVSKLNEVWTEHKKKLEEVAKLQTEVAIAVWTKQRDEMRAARDDFDNFNRQLAATAAGYDTLKAKQTEAMAVLEEYNKALVKQGGEDKVRTEELQKQAEVRKQLMLELFANQEREALATAQGRLETAHAARAAGAPGGEAAARAEASAAFNKDLFEKAQHAMEKVEKERGARISPELMTKFMGKEVTIGQIQASEEDFQKRYQAASAALEAARNRYVADNAAIDAHKRALEALTEAEKQAEAEVTKRTQTLRSAREAAHQAFETMGARLNAGDEEEMRAAGLKPGSVVGRTALRTVEAAEAFAHGDRLSLAQKETLGAVRQALVNARASTETINALMAEMADLHVNHDKKIRDLLQAMKMLSSQVKSTVF